MPCPLVISLGTGDPALLLTGGRTWALAVWRGFVQVLLLNSGPCSQVKTKNSVMSFGTTTRAGYDRCASFIGKASKRRDVLGNYIFGVVFSRAKKEPQSQKKKHEQYQSQKNARTVPKNFLNNSRHYPIKQGFEANRTRKFTRKFGRIFVAKVLWGTFSVPDICCNYQLSRRLQARSCPGIPLRKLFRRAWVP